MKVYLCGPIDNCTYEEMHGWREDLKFTDSNHKWVDPTRRDFRGKEILYNKELVELDKWDIRNSDVVLVRWNKPENTCVGSSMEILYAHSLDIPVILWCNEGEKLSPWLVYHSLHVVNSEEEALSKLRELEFVF